MYIKIVCYVQSTLKNSFIILCGEKNNDRNMDITYNYSGHLLYIHCFFFKKKNKISIIVLHTCI